MNIGGRTATKTNKVSNQCAQCGEALFAPEWSEYVKERCVRHLWSCEACGYAWETTVYLAPQGKVEDLIDDAA